MIEVRLTREEIMSVPLPEFFEAYVLYKLKNAGSPVEGTIAPKLSVGTLSQYEDMDRMAYVFRWENEAPATKG